VTFWSPSFGQIRKSIQPLDSPKKFQFVSSLKLIPAWTWQFGKIEKFKNVQLATWQKKEIAM
jgi:hypothetical protein